jgi:hypothetical protein
MCGRYKLSAVHKDVQKHFDLIDGKFEFEPSDEIFPGTISSRWIATGVRNIFSGPSKTAITAGSGER